MSTYKYGSSKLHHENAALNTPTLKWLGLKSDNLLFNSAAANPKYEPKTITRLSLRDRNKAIRMLSSEIFAEDGYELEWRREMQVMLMLNMKAEMESLGGSEEVNKWVDEELCSRIQGKSSTILPNYRV